MIKLQIIPWEQAWKNLEVEKALYTPACIHLQKYYQILWSDLEMCVDTLNLAKQEDTTTKDIAPLTEEIYEHFSHLIILCTSMPVLYPEDDWAVLINSILSILDNYVGVESTVVNEIPNDEQAFWVVQLQQMIARSSKTLELGASLENLLPAMVLLLDEVRAVHASQPISFHLSKQYLDSLGFFPTPKQEDILI